MNCFDEIYDIIQDLCIDCIFCKSDEDHKYDKGKDAREKRKKEKRKKDASTQYEIIEPGQS